MTPTSPDKAPAGAVSHRQPSIGVYRRISTLFVVLTLGMLCFAAYIIFSKATVVVLSEPTDVSGEIIVDIAREPVAGEVPGMVYQHEASLSRTFSATSVVTVETHAEGTVRIISSLYRAQTLIPSTRLVTPDGILFRLKDRVVVPALGSVEAAVFADAPGVGSAVGDATFTIPGLNEDTRRFFEVETVDPIEGGSLDVRMVTDTDLENAEGVLTQEIKDEMMAMFREKVRTDGVPMDGEMISFELLESDSSEEPGSEAEEFTLNVNVRGTAVFYSTEGFIRELGVALQDRLPFDKKLKQVNSEGMEVRLEKADIIGERANLRVAANGSATISPDAPLLDPEKITGVTIAAAVEYLQAVDGVSSASIDVSPFWAGRLPDVADNITIEVR